MSDAPIHQLVGFMAAFEPQALQRLQAQHPGQAALLPGRQLGALSAPMALRVALAAEALQAIVARGDAVADRLARRIRSSHRLELLAQLVAVLGSGGALAMLLGDGSDALKLAGVLLALLGSATAVAVKFLRRDLAGADNGLVAQHGALVKAVAQGVAAARRLQPHHRSGDDLGDPAALARVLDEANTLAGQVYGLMKQAGVPMAAAALGGVAVKVPGWLKRKPRARAALSVSVWVLAALLALQALSPAQALVIRGGAFKGGAKGAGVAGAAAAHPHLRVDAPELLRPAGSAAGENAGAATAAAAGTSKPWPGAPHLRVRTTGDAQRDALLLQALADELAVPINPDRVRAASLADDALTDDALVQALGRRSGSAEQRFLRFLREGPSAPDAATLARELTPLRGSVLLLLAHVDTAHATLSFRGIGASTRTVGIAPLEAAARQAGVQLLIVGCHSARHSSAGFAATLNSLHAAQAVLAAMRARPATVFELFAALSSERTPMLLDAARFHAERTVELVMADGSAQSTLHWVGPHPPSAAQTASQASAPPAASAPGVWGQAFWAVIGAALLSLLAGARVLWRHVERAWPRAGWMLADLAGHALLVPWLLSALAEAVAGADAVWWAWGVALLLPAVAAGLWWLAGGSRHEPLARLIAVRLAVLCVPFVAVAALHAGLRLPPLATTPLMALYRLGQPLPDPWHAAMVGITVGFVGMLLHDGWQRARQGLAEWRRRRGQRALHTQQLRASGVTGRALRRALASRRVFDAECRHAMNGDILWDRQRGIAEFTAADPWSGRPACRWALTAVPVVVPWGAAARQLSPDTAYGLARVDNGYLHPLPQALAQRWLAGQLPAEALPALLARVEPRLRGIDFLKRRPQRWVYAFVISCGVLFSLLFAGIGGWGMDADSEGRQAFLSGAAVMALLLVAAPLALVLRHRLLGAWLRRVQAPPGRQRHNGPTATASPGAAT